MDNPKLGALFFTAKVAFLKKSFLGVTFKIRQTNLENPHKEISKSGTFTGP